MSMAGTARGTRRRRAIELKTPEQRGRTTDDELRAVAARYNEDIELLAGLRRAAPFAPRLEAAL